MGLIKDSLFAVFSIFAYCYSASTLLCVTPVFLLNLNEKLPEYLEDLMPTISGNVHEKSDERTFDYEILKNNLFLLGQFAIIHSIMSTLWFKKIFFGLLKLVTFGLIDHKWDRSIFVTVAATQLIAVYKYWISMNYVLYEVSECMVNFFYFLNFTGYLVLFLATFNLDHFEFFGLRDGLKMGDTFRLYPKDIFVKDYFYGFCRHPIMVALFLMLWTVPVMTLGSLVFSSACTLYILFAVFLLEEPRLVYLSRNKKYGYKNYKREVGAFCPFFVSGKSKRD